MTNLIYVLDSVGEYTIAEEMEDSVTVIGQVDDEKYAKLFCAAPDLLEALQETLEKVENILLMEFSVNPSDRDYVVHARAAIARALGEKQ